MHTSTRNDQDYLSDLLISEKQLCSTYTTAATEAKTENIRTGFKDILTCELDVQSKLFNVMESKGWYQLENAQQDKIQQAKSKFQSFSN